VDRKAVKTCDLLVLTETLALVAQTAMTEGGMSLAIPFYIQGDHFFAVVIHTLTH